MALTLHWVKPSAQQLDAVSPHQPGIPSVHLNTLAFMSSPQSALTGISEVFAGICKATENLSHPAQFVLTWSGTRRHSLLIALVYLILCCLISFVLSFPPLLLHFLPSLALFCLYVFLFSVILLFKLEPGIVLSNMSKHRQLLHVSQLNVW